jgi:predicted transcriptional regulator
VVRKSKLEIRVDILKILASQGPKKLTQLVHKTNLSQSVLEQHLDFLVQQDLVEEQNLGKDEIFYAITGRALCMHALLCVRAHSSLPPIYE